jgi:hypothetical protein
VWIQLLQRCATELTLQPRIVGSMLGHMQQQHQQVAQQAARLEQQEQLVQVLERQLQEVLAVLRRPQ